MEYVDGKLNVLCHQCSAAKKKNASIEAGPKEKSLSNLKAHIKTPMLVKNVADYKNAENRGKESWAIDENMETKRLKRIALEEVHREHPGMFEELQNTNVKRLRCLVCNGLIKIWPERGTLIFNVNEHAKTHTKSSRKHKQLSVDSFFKPKNLKLRIDNYSITIFPFATAFITIIY